jgi:hypothetical protein
LSATTRLQLFICKETSGFSNRLESADYERTPFNVFNVMNAFSSSDPLYSAWHVYYLYACPHGRMTAIVEIIY